MGRGHAPGKSGCDLFPALAPACRPQEFLRKWAPAVPPRGVTEWTFRIQKAPRCRQILRRELPDECSRERAAFGRLGRDSSARHPVIQLWKRPPRDRGELDAPRLVLASQLAAPRGQGNKLRPERRFYSPRVPCWNSLNRLSVLFRHDLVEKGKIVEAREIGFRSSKEAVGKSLFRSRIQSRVQRVVGDLHA